MSDTTNKVSHAYVEAEKRLEDASSTAWAFTLMGILGSLALLLVWTGVLPLNISFTALLLATIVLGILFLIFLIVGIRAFHDKKVLISARTAEDASIQRIRQWFEEHYSADAISNGVDEEDLSIDQLYFLRSENISRLLTEEFSELEESFAEYILEIIYQMYFPD